MDKSGPYPFKQALPWVLFVTLIFWLNYSARACLSPLLVSVETDLGVGHAAATSLLLMQSIGFSCALFCSGFLVSRIRPHLVVTIAQIGAGLVLLCMPMVHSLSAARAVFICFGLFAGLYFPAGMATLTSLVDKDHLGRAVAVHELAPNLGFILMPLLVQAGLFFTSWQGVYAAIGALLILFGLAFLLFGRGGRSYMAPPTLSGLKFLFRNSATWALMFLMTILTVGEYSVFSILQIFMVDNHGLSPELANLTMSASRLASPFAVILGGWAADRLNPHRTLNFSFALHILALVMMCLPSLPVAFIGMLLQAASIAVTFPSIFKIMNQIWPAQMQSVLLSIVMPVSALTSAGLAPQLLGWCGQYLNFQFGLACVAVATAGCFVCIRIFRNKAVQQKAD